MFTFNNNSGRVIVKPNDYSYNTEKIFIDQLKHNYNKINIKNNYSGYSKKEYYKALGLFNEE